MPGKCRTLGSRSAGICRTHFSEMKLISQLNRKHWSNFGWGFFCYLKSIMYLDFPTLPSCNTVCLSFSCQAKLHVSYDCCDLWYVWTRQMKCYLQNHLKILDRCLHLVPHPSCPLSEVQFVALCHLSWRGTRNHNNTNQQSSACLLRIEIPLRGIRIKQAVMNSLHGCRTGLLSTMGQLCSSSPANPLGAHWHAESANFHSQALFRSHQSSKFFHSLSITSIFGHIYGALNVDKKSN